MIRIGLTGGLCSGKSTVSKMLAELGAYTLDSDNLVHRAYAKGTPGWAQVVDAFGSQVVGMDGEIDRTKLSAIVFEHEPQQMKRLIDIVQPHVIPTAMSIFAEQERAGVLVAVLESAVIIESGDNQLFDQIWVTHVPEEVALRRQARRHGLRLSREQARWRMSLQMSADEKIKYADVVFRTDCSLNETRAQVLAAWRMLRIGRDCPRGTVEGLT